MPTPIAWSLSGRRPTSQDLHPPRGSTIATSAPSRSSWNYAAGYSEDVSVLEGKDGSQSVVAPRVTPNLFPMLGAQPLLGRTFTEAEGQTGGPQVVLLSEGLWRQTFHADPRHRRPDGENWRQPLHGDWRDAGLISLSGRNGPGPAERRVVAVAAHGRDVKGPGLSLLQRCG